MTDVEFFVDPSCPWAWVTSRWAKEVATARDLTITWRSYCLEIRDDYDVAPTVPPQYAGDRAGRACRLAPDAADLRGGAGRVPAKPRSTRSTRNGDGCISTVGPAGGDALLAACLASSGLDADLVGAADDAKWDTPIVESMEVAYAFGGPKTQTPTIVVRATPPYGFKGPVMAPAPTGEAAVRLWDAITVLALEPGFFEITRPRVNPPRPRRAS